MPSPTKVQISLDAMGPQCVGETTAKSCENVKSNCTYCCHTSECFGSTMHGTSGGCISFAQGVTCLKAGNIKDRWAASTRTKVVETHWKQLLFWFRLVLVAVSALLVICICLLSIRRYWIPGSEKSSAAQLEFQPLIVKPQQHRQQPQQSQHPRYSYGNLRRFHPQPAHQQPPMADPQDVTQDRPWKLLYRDQIAKASEMIENASQ